MRCAIYNPYLDSLGGGELYTISVAKVLKGSGHAVDLYWKDPGIKGKLVERFGIDLSSVNIVPDVKRGSGYDFCFWVSDGSIPALLARKNFLHFQVPFQNVGGKTLLNKMKLFRINKIICNSGFTKEVIDREYGVTSSVLYPPVALSEFKRGRKENVILYVGRFSQLLQKKRQDVLVKCFKKLYDTGVKDYKMVLAGGTELGSDTYINRLKKDSKGYPIKIIEKPNFSELKKLYSASKIFWSASGYGVNEKKKPEEVEHFGITLVEAMATGSVPLAYNSGGHKEIIENGTNGYLWNKTNNLIVLTGKLINDNKLLRKLSGSAVEASKKFSYENFRRELLSLIG